MTAAGIALLAGGIATLITFRTALFGQSVDVDPVQKPIELVLSWPPIDDAAPGRIFPGRPGDRPTVMENRHGAQPPR
jgi:hypothetical protein